MEEGEEELEKRERGRAEEAVGPRDERRAEQSSAREIRARLSSALLAQRLAHSRRGARTVHARSSEERYRLGAGYQSNSYSKESLNVLLHAKVTKCCYTDIVSRLPGERALSTLRTIMFATTHRRSCGDRCGRGRVGRGGGGGESPLESDRESEMRQDELLKHSVRCVDTLHVDENVSTAASHSEIRISSTSRGACIGR